MEPTITEEPEAGYAPQAAGIRLALHDIQLSFGSKDVLRQLSLRAEPGEFIAIVGRSGCGKSTLLRVIAGLEQVSAGQVLLDGERIRTIHPDARVLFQDPRLLPWKRVVSNVRIGTKDRLLWRAEEALKQVGLLDRARDWPSVLSGGQQQRVALARALASVPRLLLLDEPLGALDALTRIEMQRLIESLWSRHRFTALLVTHDVSEAVQLADRVVLIDQGEIALDVRITLPRPRVHDSGFSYFEQLILDRILVQEHPADTSYSI